MTPNTGGESRLSATDPARVGPYEILRRLGAGGMGTVYLAADRSGRQVAIKMVRTELARTAEFRERFKHEADNARRVARFCTAAVLDVDIAADPPYLVTEYVDGPTLSEAVNSRGPLTPAELHQLAVSMTTALMAIHRAGIVHRDLKPSNVLLSRLGPKVIDFGIARALDSVSLLTEDRQVGTPAFMAPEQARGEVVTSAADVFAWGGLLLYAGTGRYPFGSGQAAALLYRTVNEEPSLDGFEISLRPLVEAAMRKSPRLRPSAEQLYAQLLDLRMDVPAAAAELPLSEVTALVRPLTTPPPPLPQTPPSLSPPSHPSSPHASPSHPSSPSSPSHSSSSPPASPFATDFGGALATVRTGEHDYPGLIAARPPGSERRRRLGTGGRLVVAGIVAAVAATTVLTLGLADRSDSSESSHVADKVAAKALRLQVSDPGLARRLALAAYSAEPDSPATRNALLAFFGADVAATTVEVGDGAVLAAEFRPSGGLVAAGSLGGSITLWDVSELADPVQVGTLRGHDGWVRTLAFNRDGTVLASGGADDTVRLWDVTDPTTPTALSTVDFHSDDVRSVAFSPDGNTLASGSSDGSIALWAVTDPTRPVERSHADGRTGGVRSVAFAPAGDLLAYGGEDGTVRLWDVRDAAVPTPSAVLQGHDRAVPAVAFDPTGTTLASGGVDTTLRQWDVNEPTSPLERPTVVGQVGGINDVAFSPDSALVASAGDDTTVRLADVSDPTNPVELVVLQEHTRSVSGVSFSPDGSLALSAGYDGTLRLWLVDPTYLAAAACGDPANRITAAEWTAEFDDLAYVAPCGG